MASLSKTLRQDPVKDYIGTVKSKNKDGIKVEWGNRAITAKSAISTPIVKNMRVVITKTESGWRIIGIEQSVQRNIREVKIDG